MPIWGTASRSLFKKRLPKHFGSFLAPRFELLLAIGAYSAAVCLVWCGSSVASFEKGYLTVCPGFLSLCLLLCLSFSLPVCSSSVDGVDRREWGTLPRAGVAKKSCVGAGRLAPGAAQTPTRRSGGATCCRADCRHPRGPPLLATPRCHLALFLLSWQALGADRARQLPSTRT